MYTTVRTVVPLHLASGLSAQGAEEFDKSAHFYYLAVFLSVVGYFYSCFNGEMREERGQRKGAFILLEVVWRWVEIGGIDLSI